MFRSKRFGLIAAFTLVSACALVGLGTAPVNAAASFPHTATASTVTHGSLTAADSGPSISRNSAATPDIKINQNCSGTSQARSWVNIDIWTQVGLEDWCFGYAGTWTFNQTNFNTVHQFCSGTNYGTFKYRKVIGGPITTLIFPSGYNIDGIVWLPVSLEISGWNGSYKCPVS